jgi:predicted nucleic acid-binding protein
MSRYYLDASALVKRYVNESGSDWLRASLASIPSPLLFTCRISIVEVASAFARRVREGSLTADEFTVALDAFRGDCLNEYQIMPPTTPVIDEACALVERYPLRAYDAVHLASALAAQQFLAAREYPPLAFVSADDNLNDAATAEGLAVDNPNHHR